MVRDANVCLLRNKKKGCKGHLLLPILLGSLTKNLTCCGFALLFPALHWIPFRSRIDCNTLLFTSKAYSMLDNLFLSGPQSKGAGISSVHT